jgi:phosphoglucosamine mutase
MALEFFGTDGIRGRYGLPPIHEGFACVLARACLRFLDLKGVAHPLVVMGRDTRASGVCLSEAFAAAFEAGGGQVLDLGVIPTPQVAFQVRERSCDLGLAITASHNPFTDNGFKLFAPGGCKFSVEDEMAIEAHIRAVTCAGARPAGGYLCRTHVEDPVAAYEAYLKKCFPSLRLDAFHVVLDCANGATWQSSPRLLRAFGAKVDCIGVEPDGENINRGVGSECPQALQERVRATGADLGIAHDGDGDRLVLCDRLGNLISGEHFLGWIARFGASDNRSRPDHPLVTTRQSNLALDRWVQEGQGCVLRTDIGDRHVTEALVREQASFGGENSGHYVFRDILPTGDGLVAALKLMESVILSGKPVEAIRESFALYPSRLLNVKLPCKPPMESLLHLQSCIAGIESELNGDGRVMVRYSGTEPKIRLLVECASAAGVETHLESLQNALRKDQGDRMS